MSTSEGSPVGQSVIQIRATDADKGINAEITYKITAGDNRGEKKLHTNKLNVRLSANLAISKPYCNLYPKSDMRTRFSIEKIERTITI